MEYECQPREKIVKFFQKISIEMRFQVQKYEKYFKFKNYIKKAIKERFNKQF